MSEEEKKAYDNLKMLQYFTMEKEDKQSINIILNYIDKLQKENEEIRQWKYIIDTYEDLDKLKELDIIKIKGKEYISKNIYDELRKDKEALIRNYDKVLKLIDKG